ncbi:MAG: DUF4190 domain-containing protein [Bacteroidales bacterium]
MEQNSNRSAQNFGIAALVTGIITFIMAVIPCIGILAIIPGIVTIILAIFGLTRSATEGRGLVIAGLIIGVVATLISISQWAIFSTGVRNKSFVGSEIRKAVEEVRSGILDEIESGNFSIRVESGGEVVEIKSTIDAEKLEERINKLEKLEGLTKPDTAVKK